MIDDVKDALKQEFEVRKTKNAGITSVTIFARGDGYKIDAPLTLDNKGTDGTGASIVVSEILGKDVESVTIGVSTFPGTELRKDKGLIVGVTTIPHEISSGETVVLSGIVEQYLLGNYRYFGSSVASLDFVKGWLPFLIVTILCGFFGGCFSKLLWCGFKVLKIF